MNVYLRNCSTPRDIVMNDTYHSEIWASNVLDRGIGKMMCPQPLDRLDGKLSGVEGVPPVDAASVPGHTATAASSIPLLPAGDCFESFYTA
jgi:hypothetical protein